MLVRDTANYVLLTGSYDTIVPSIDGNLNSITNHSTDNIKDNQSELEKIANKKAKAKKKQVFTIQCNNQ